MIVRLLVVLLFLLISPNVFSHSQNEVYPGSGERALANLSQEIVSNLNVLYIALRPGYENLSTLAYYRLGKGARIRAAYVTNGESGESDVRGTLPLQLAAQLRNEATSALESLDGEAYFMNLPDVAAASDSSALAAHWPVDSLVDRFEVLISEFQPDLVLLGPDREYGETSMRFSVIQSALLRTIRSLYQRGDQTWKPTRVASETQKPKGLPIPVREESGLEKMSFEDVGNNAGRAYASLRIQREQWQPKSIPLYRIVHPLRFTGKSLDEKLPPPPNQHLRNLDAQIRAFAAGVAKPSLKTATGEKRLHELNVLMDSLNQRIIYSHLMPVRDRRLLLSWKAGLENIRNTLLDVRVEFTVSDTILTERQLTYLNISKINGLSESGITQLFVPAVQDGWVLNEDSERRVHLKIGEDYRLLSPLTVEYYYPREEYGLFHTTVRKPSYFFVLHESIDRTKSFVHRSDMRLSFAPRFSVEVLTPIVRAIPGEYVVVRLTNNSRDGVRDTVYVSDSVASSEGKEFRMNTKGMTFLDTLRLQWNEDLTEGTHVFSIKISGITQRKFAARKIEVATDTTRRIGVLSGIEQSSTINALRRIGYNATHLSPDQLADDLTGQLDVIIVDRRAMTLLPSPETLSASLEKFANSGGHVIILAQDGPTLPLLKGVTLSPSFRLDERSKLLLDGTHPLLLAPNKLKGEDFEGWAYRTAYNTVSVKGQFENPVLTAGTRFPLVVSRKEAKGRITYVDLALQSQWQNVHAGSLRLLANLVALR